MLGRLLRTASSVLRSTRAPTPEATAAAIRADPNIARIKRERVKKSLALICSYVGSNYRGLQMMPLEEEDRMERKSVEYELQLALRKAEFILPTNFGSPGRVGISRASRTDRGVHSAGNVMGARLLVPRDDRSDEAMATMTAQLNELLPEDIRVHEVTMVRRNFNARRTCFQRRYEYLMPKMSLNDASESAPWRQCVPMMEGRFYFHNFAHRLKLPPATPADMGDSMKAMSLTERLDYQVDAWETIHHSEKNKMQRTMDKIEVDDVTIDGVDFVRLIIRGESFMYHQIRMMAGFLYAVDAGQLDVEDLRPALGSPLRYPVPLAPGEFLLQVLEKNVFYRTDQKHTRQFEPKNSTYKASRLFKKQRIYPEIARFVRESFDLEASRDFMSQRVLPAEERAAMREYYAEWAHLERKRLELRREREREREERYRKEGRDEDGGKTRNVQWNK